MGLFNDETAELEALRSELALLKAQMEKREPSKSAEAERIGLHSSDRPRTFAQWMSYRKRVGDATYRSRKVQEQVQRDFGLLGRDAFYGND
ncbi:hypothetical protein [Tabrizicola sp.]|uniref:hypothetical protein n=1 Tax=Tabrizicola sp. TaxID=2005166 RepID=UPI0035B1DE3F